MTRARHGDPGAVLEELRERLPERKANLARLVEIVREGLHDRRRLRDAGLALDEIAAGKLHRAYGHRGFEALLQAELGITRMWAFKLRTIAKALGAEDIARLGVGPAYELVRGAVKPQKKRTDREGAKIARELRARLRRNGARDATVEPFVHAGKKMLRIELAADDADVI